VPADGRSVDQRAPGRLPDPIVYLYPDDVAAYHRQVRQNGLAVPELDVTFYGLTELDRRSGWEPAVDRPGNGRGRLIAPAQRSSARTSCPESD
jgi:hypothetical protein